MSCHQLYFTFSEVWGARGPLFFLKRLYATCLLASRIDPTDMPFLFQQSRHVERLKLGVEGTASVYPIDKVWIRRLSFFVLLAFEQREAVFGDLKGARKADLHRVTCFYFILFYFILLNISFGVNKLFQTQISPLKLIYF